MFPVILAQVKTRDGVRLDGIAALPRRKTKTAVVWLHGLSSRFSSGQTLARELSQRCTRLGVGYFKFNNRGHDIVNRDGAGRNQLQGAGFEKFEDCVHDIRAVINFAKRLGYCRIILAGHSTGANKTLYYIYKTRDRSVKGIILAGPLSDIASDYKLFGMREVRKRLAVAAQLRRKNSNLLLPQEYGVWSARRYLSILTPGKPEDVFPYHNPNARWKELRSVRVPILVAVGSRDKHLDRSAKTLVKIFRANARETKSFSGIIVKGADHGFWKNEKELVRAIIDWIKKI